MITQQLSLDGVNYSICLPDAETDYIQNKILTSKQPYELEMLRDMAARVQPGDLVLDVGANIGNHTLYLASAAGCRVHSFEPNDQLCAALAQSVMLNNFSKQISIHQVGAGATEGFARFSHLDSTNLGAQSLEQVEDDAPASIKLVTLDSMEWSAVVRLIKVDVEGMELDVLKGAQQLISKDRPVLYIESQTPDHFTHLSALLNEMGYLYCATFNATPTHVFLHESTLLQSGALPAVLAEKAKQLYTFKAETAELRGKLHDSNLKYRKASERINKLAALSDQSANEYSEARTEIAALKLDIESQNRALKQAREEKVVIQRTLSALRSSLTYKVGLQVQASSRSFKDALKLPIRLWRLRKQAARAKTSVPVAARAKTTTPVADKPNMVAVPPRPDFDRASLHTAGLVAKPCPQVRMACIMDGFTQSSYEPECELFQLTPQQWQAELEFCQPELLFIESAWRGKDELWGSKVGHCSEELQGIVAWCRERQIPTVFWNKEDPIHFETFLTTAQMFDFVFTTDMDCIHRYKEALGHEHIYFLPFACQPSMHNPIEKYPRQDAFCFAGAYYAGYPERTRDLESFVKELPAYRPLEIYDRNYGKDDSNYQFPEVYQPYIVGTLPFSEIDKAYKGYRYAINLNSIKQSQTMFARRVYELLGSNTLTISNYSRGVRLMFGDLVVTSDSGSEVRRRLKQLEASSVVDRLRLAGLRKVMSEHTYADRLNYVLEKITGEGRNPDLPRFTVVTRVGNEEEAQSVINNTLRQQGVDVELLLVCREALSVAGAQALLGSASMRVRALQEESLHTQNLQELAGKDRWVCGMNPNDYYGKNYLLDCALATRYSKAKIIGKAAYFVMDEQGDVLKRSPESAYQQGESLAVRRAIIHPEIAEGYKALEWLQNLGQGSYEATDQLAIDYFNYCEGAGSIAVSAVNEKVDDLQLNQGIALRKLTEIAEAIEPMQSDLEHAPWLDGAQFAHALLGETFTWLNGHGLAGSKDEERDLKLSRNPALSARLFGPLLEIGSNLPDGNHEYIYAAAHLSLTSVQDQLGNAENECIPVHFQIDPGLNLSLVVLYLDGNKQRLGHDILQANRNTQITPLHGTEYLRLGLRVLAGGSCKVHRLVLGHLDLEPANIIGQSDVLLLTNHYPSYDELYRNGFVHSRVRAYREHGVKVDVFRLRKEQSISWHEFENIDVTTGSQQALRRMLASDRYRHVLVHFLDPDMWEVLKEYIDVIKITVWVHGADIQPWYRRKFNIETPEQELAAKKASEERMTFWHSVLNPMPANLYIVFVSDYFAEEVMSDLGYRLPKEKFSIIHNPIDTDLFNYVEKDPKQRKKILSVRPYSSKVYANDLSVKAVIELSKESFFDELEFRFVGNGALFDETLEPLRKFNNVIIERGFLAQADIAELHKDYGVFLVPSRMDTQGVSRDEAMSSGLVAISNACAAIPEFIDESCGFLANPDCYTGLAKGIAALYEDDKLFLALSRNASRRARTQVSKYVVIKDELSVFSPIDVTLDDNIAKLKEQGFLDKLQCERIGVLAKNLNNEEFVSTLIETYVSSDSLLADAEVLMGAKVLFSLYVGHRNFVVLNVVGIKVVLVQHHVFCHVLYLPDFDRSISIAGSVVDVDLMKGFAKEVSRLGGYDSLMAKISNIKTKAIFFGYDRPYHYFYDSLPQLLRYRNAISKSVKIFSLVGFDFYDVSAFFPDNPSITCNGFGGLNAELLSQGAICLSLGYCKRDIVNSTESDALIKQKSEDLLDESELNKLLGIKRDNSLLLWIGVCTEKRSWLNQEQELRGVFSELLDRGIKFHVFFDGITSTVSNTLHGFSYPELDVVSRLTEKLLSASQYSILVGAPAHRKIVYAQYADMFITNFLTDSMYPARFGAALGLVHGANKAIRYEHINASSYYLPSEFVDDSVSKGNWSTLSYSVQDGAIKSLFLSLIDNHFSDIIVGRIGFKDSLTPLIDLNIVSNFFSFKFSLDGFSYGRINDDYKTFEDVTPQSLRLLSSNRYLLNFSCAATSFKGIELHVIVVSRGSKIVSHKLRPNSSILLGSYNEEVGINLYIRLSSCGYIRSGKISLLRIESDA